MGSLVGLGRNAEDVVEQVLPFVDEDEGLALSEALLVRKPEANPGAKAFLYWDNGYLHLSNGKNTFVPNRHIYYGW